MRPYQWRGKPEPTPQAPTKAKCGTYSGYKTHYLRKEKPCEPCRQAGIKYKQAYRAQQKLDAAKLATKHPGTLRLHEAVAEAYEPRHSTPVPQT